MAKKLTPDDHAKSGTEHGNQKALFAWANDMRHAGWFVAELDSMFAIPNQGGRGRDAKGRAIMGAQMAAEGVKPGVPDVFLPVGRMWAGKVLHGLFIELKRRVT